MFSQCTHCKTWQAVTAAQLRHGRGLLVCSNCAEYFDALATISEVIEAEPDKSVESFEDSLPLSLTKSPKAVWSYALLLNLVVLFGQIGYFEGQKFLLQPQVRSVLLSVCSFLHCDIPPFKDLQNCLVLQSDLRDEADNRLRVSVALINKAALPQSFPAINLILKDLNGNAVAQRVFLPHEYQHAASLQVDEVEEISLSVVPPVGVKIGGYSIALL
jgi:predicted Zn finger-like uncharacterized protein